MKKIFLLLPVLLMSFMLTANAQNLKSILKKHYAAVGQASINKAEAVVLNGKISQMGMELPFVVYQKRPGKAKFEASFQDMKIVQAFDGKAGWSINPMSGPAPVDMGPDEVKTMKSMAEIEGRLYNWKKKHYKVVYEGMEEFNGDKFYKIKLNVPDGAEESYFIDPTTYLVKKVDSKDKIQGMDVESTKIFSDYRPVQGYQVPFKTETEMMGQTAGELDVISFEIKTAAEVPDSLFAKPASE